MLQRARQTQCNVRSPASIGRTSSRSSLWARLTAGMPRELTITRSPHLQ